MKACISLPSLRHIAPQDGRAITMGILSLVKEKCRSLILCGLLAVCAWAEAEPCVRINDTFFVSHWVGSPPASVSIEVIKHAQHDLVRNITFTYRAELLGNDNQAAGRVLRLTATPPTVPDLLAQDDYRIVLDGKIEYLIHSIELPDSTSRGCLIRSAVVGSCKVQAGNFISFDAGCGSHLP